MHSNTICVGQWSICWSQGHSIELVWILPHWWVGGLNHMLLAVGFHKGGCSDPVFSPSICSCFGNSSVPLGYCVTATRTTCNYTWGQTLGINNITSFHAHCVSGEDKRWSIAFSSWGVRKVMPCSLVPLIRSKTPPSPSVLSLARASLYYHQSLTLV